jgi:hypothetical protein
MFALLLCTALVDQSLWASPHKIDEYHWDQVDRIVAIGDLHGDYGSYLKSLESAGIINARGQWAAARPTSCNSVIFGSR